MILLDKQHQAMLIHKRNLFDTFPVVLVDNLPQKYLFFLLKFRCLLRGLCFLVALFFTFSRLDILFGKVILWFKPQRQHFKPPWNITEKSLFSWCRFFMADTVCILRSAKRYHIVLFFLGLANLKLECQNLMQCSVYIVYCTHSQLSGKGLRVKSLNSSLKQAEYILPRVRW
jgi:hypothetical protein